MCVFNILMNVESYKSGSSSSRSGKTDFIFNIEVHDMNIQKRTGALYGPYICVPITRTLLTCAEYQCDKTVRIYT